MKLAEDVAADTFSPGEVDEAFTDAKKWLSRLKKAYRLDRGDRADSQVQYLQSRHDVIDALFRACIAETRLLIRTGGDRRRELEERVRVLEARLAMVENQPKSAYRGVWSATEEYSPGDQATCAGSLWIASAENRGVKPGTGTGWKLAVKKGRAA